MPSTYTPIATSTVTGTTTNQVTFTGIPSTYTDIIVVASARSNFASTSDQFLCRVGNGSLDSGSNYSRTELYTDGTNVNSTRTTNDTWVRFGFSITGANATSGIFSANTIHFMNYSNTNTNKTILATGGTPTGWSTTYVNLWRSTSAIERIQLFCGNGVFIAGTIFTLYGIKAA